MLSIHWELILIRAPWLDIIILFKVCLLVFNLFHRFSHGVLFCVCYMIYILKLFLTSILRIIGRLFVWIFTQTILTITHSFMSSSYFFLVIFLIYLIFKALRIGKLFFLILQWVVLTTTSPLYYIRNLV